MNDIDNAISQLNVAKPANLNVRLMTEEERAQMAVLDNKKYNRKKYKMALQFGAKMKLYELSNAHPEWGAKDVLVDIMKDYYSDFPAELVLEMSEYIVTEWEKIKASKKELVMT
jgi:hypothetical protein